MVTITGGREGHENPQVCPTSTFHQQRQGQVTLHHSPTPCLKPPETLTPLLTQTQGAENPTFPHLIGHPTTHLTTTITTPSPPTTPTPSTGCYGKRKQIHFIKLHSVQ